MRVYPAMYPVAPHHITPFTPDPMVLTRACAGHQTLLPYRSARQEQKPNTAGACGVKACSSGGVMRLCGNVSTYVLAWVESDVLVDVFQHSTHTIILPCSFTHHRAPQHTPPPT